MIQRVGCHGLYVLTGLLLLSFATAAEDSVKTRHDFINHAGYRYDKLRAPTPQQVPGGITITTEELIELIDRDDPVLIDVQAVTVRPELREFAMDWLPSKTRYSLPDATWLPNVGYAELDTGIEDYFRNNLRRLTAGNLRTPVVIYCVLDCWLSWNAVQRAVGYGYRRVYWYRLGTDGWEAAGQPLTAVDPTPLHP